MTADQDTRTRRRTLTAEELRKIVQEELEDHPVVNNYNQPDFDRWNFLAGAAATAAIVWAVMWGFVGLRESLDNARVHEADTKTEQVRSCRELSDESQRVLCITLVDHP